MSQTGTGPSGPTTALSDTLAAVAGALFIGVAGFLTTAALIWALSMMLGLPLLATEIVEGGALIGFVALTGFVIRHALRLQRARDDGALV